mmetsp:Transcript_29032/g.85842  ORF Transcript_29032/g.85842 Transcript_29032/m.85842 type:complete len:274 (-) Transcript_29032:339-1160(-)
MRNCMSANLSKASSPSIARVRRSSASATFFCSHDGPRTASSSSSVPCGTDGALSFARTVTFQTPFSGSLHASIAQSSSMLGRPAVASFFTRASTAATMLSFSTQHATMRRKVVSCGVVLEASINIAPALDLTASSFSCEGAPASNDGGASVQSTTQCARHLSAGQSMYSSTVTERQRRRSPKRTLLENSAGSTETRSASYTPLSRSMASMTCASGSNTRPLPSTISYMIRTFVSSSSGASIASSASLTKTSALYCRAVGATLLLPSPLDGKYA